MRNYLLACLIVLSPATALAADTGDVPQYVQNIDYTLEQPFAGESTIGNLGHYIQTVYKFALGIVGIFAVVLIMFGGLRWLAAAGNESAIGDAKEIITSAVSGLVIALLSFTILAFINPRTTNLSLSIFRIPNTLADQKIIDLPKCDSAQFTGKECNVEGSGKKNCDEVTCNEVGLYDAQYCRGIACGKDENGNDLSCYRGPTDPEAYACQNTMCGRYAQACAETGFKDQPDALDYTARFNACACDYYETDIPRWFGWPADLAKDTMTDIQEAYFYGFCAESTPQDTMADDIAANPKTYGYSTSTADSALSEGWNCGFGCTPGTYFHNFSSEQLICS